MISIILTAIFSSCQVTVSESSSRNIPKATYISSATGHKITFDGSRMMVYSLSGNSLLGEYSYRYRGEYLAITPKVLYDSEGNPHTLKSELEALNARYDEIRAFAVPAAIESVHDIAIHGLREYDYDFSNYEAAVNAILTSKVTNFLASQKGRLTRYIHNKYNEYHCFKYNVDDEGNLILTQEFTPSTFCTSSYLSDGSSIFLNDFENNIPCMMVFNNKIYMGTPIINSKGFSVTLDYFMDLSEDTELIVAYYKGIIEKVLTDNEKDILAEGFFYEVYKERFKSAPEIPTAHEMINLALKSTTITGDIDMESDPPSLTISNPSCDSDGFSGSIPVLTNPKPFLEFSGQLLTKQDDSQS
ncbi:MAG: hypothetical protein II547_04565 [Treponema sp.]|nr:hypothetical protein [Treponema sp.]